MGKAWEHLSCKLDQRGLGVGGGGWLQICVQYIRVSIKPSTLDLMNDLGPA